MSFTRALEITENLDQGGGGQQQQQQPRVRVQQQPQQEPQSAGEDGRRDSVYDMSSYEISVWRHAHKSWKKKKEKNYKKWDYEQY